LRRAVVRLRAAFARLCFPLLAFRRAIPASLACFGCSRAGFYAAWADLGKPVESVRFGTSLA
jgi:hypothetical protein